MYIYIYIYISLSLSIYIYTHTYTYMHVVLTCIGVARRGPRGDEENRILDPRAPRRPRAKRGWGAA